MYYYHALKKIKYYKNCPATSTVSNSLPGVVCNVGLYFNAHVNTKCFVLLILFVVFNIKLGEVISVCVSVRQKLPVQTNEANTEVP